MVDSPGAESPPAPEPQPAPEEPDRRTLELLACFAATGTLPWWAPRQDARLIPASVAQALRLPPQVLSPFLRQLAANPASFERLLAASDAPQQPQLLQLLGSPFAASFALGPKAAASRLEPPEPSPNPEEIPPSRAALVDAPTASPASGAPELSASPSQPLGQEPALPPHSRPGQPPLALPPRAGDTIAVDGAGLALLWPFLPTLFERLGWLTPERRFIGPVPQQRALALLGYLLDGDPRPPEWRLPLVKLLCGLPLDAVFALEDDLSAAELAEADKLLQAVLAHGDGLLGEDAASLREIWLQRPGLLSWRPQAWLLVVERREAIDGALERLPWTVSWLSLPWMVELVQVGW